MIKTKISYALVLGMHIASAMCLLSCKKEKTQNPTDTAKEITFKVKDISLPLQGRPLTSFYWVSKDKTSDVFYIHNNSGDASASLHGMYKYAAASNTFTDVAHSPKLNSAGYISGLVASANYLYYCANDFTRYSITTNTWEDLSPLYPSTAKANNGEAGVVELASKLYFVGGRSPASQRLKYYDINSQKWLNGADYPLSANNGPAIATDGTRYLYTRSDVPNDFYQYDTQNNTWAKLANCPANIRKANQLNLMCYLSNKTLVLLGDDKKIHVYDIALNKWTTTDIALPINDTVYCHVEAGTSKNKFYVFYLKSSSQLGVLEYTLDA
jgi:hypothetical protein